MSVKKLFIKWFIGTFEFEKCLQIIVNDVLDFIINISWVAIDVEFKGIVNIIILYIFCRNINYLIVSIL